MTVDRSTGEVSAVRASPSRRCENCKSPVADGERKISCLRANVALRQMEMASGPVAIESKPTSGQ